jgi:type II secretory pathway pseudopilin PulG
MFKVHKNSSRKTAGDTLVEVLVSFSILGFFTIVSTQTAIDSLKSSQATQERSEAISILQSQIEFLHSLSSSTAFKPILTGSSTKVFCIDPSSGNVTPLTGSHATAVPAVESDNLATPSAYPGACVQSKYFISISAPTASDSSFVFRARWDGLSNPNEEVVFRYVVYNGNVAIAPPAPAPAPSPSPSPPPASPTCPIPLPVRYDWMGSPIDTSYQANRITGPDGTGPQQINGSFGGVSLPAWNNYTVTLRSYDTHDFSSPDPSKVNERWRVIFEESNGNATYTSPYSNDVPDVAAPAGVDYRQGAATVFTGQTITAGSGGIIAQHINAGSDGFHVQSVVVSCP